MLEGWRYQRALEGAKKYPGEDHRAVFLDQELLTQRALDHLGVRSADTPPSKVAKVGRMFMTPELIPELRVPYAVEVLGMPDAGKSTMINRYLLELWSRNERHRIALVAMWKGIVKKDYGYLRSTEPFNYSMLGGTQTYIDYVNQVQNVNNGMRVMVSDRGQIDRRVFRRTLFIHGNVNPKIMADEQKFIYGVENTPVQVGGIIMMMVRPSETMSRDPKRGPVKNPEFLKRLYEQYWRLHWEIMQGEVPFRVYTCIDAEQDQEEVYGRFKYAMDNILNIHSIYSMALAQAFPKEFDQASAEKSQRGREDTMAQKFLSKKLEDRVLIVGGDDMRSDAEILDRPVIEGYRLKNRPGN